MERAGQYANPRFAQGQGDEIRIRVEGEPAPSEQYCAFLLGFHSGEDGLNAGDRPRHIRLKVVHQGVVAGLQHAFHARHRGVVDQYFRRA